MKTLSLIIIEYFTPEDLVSCIAEFRKWTVCLSVEIIVSSNSCYDLEQQALLRSELPAVKWVFNPKNGGFSYGMNRGLEKASGEFLLVSNPDVRIQSSLEPALKYLSEHPKVGAIGPQILDENGKIQDSCRNFMCPAEMLKRQFIRLFTTRDVLLEKNRDYQKVQSVDWVIGGFILLKRELYGKVGGFDEGYFLYVEDMDWNYRFHRAGYEVHYFPSLVVTYKGDRKSTRTLFHDKKLISHYGWLHFKSYCRFLRKWGVFFK